MAWPSLTGEDAEITYFGLQNADCGLIKDTGCGLRVKKLTIDECRLPILIKKMKKMSAFCGFFVIFNTN
jgi:hypothetical protein